MQKAAPLIRTKLRLPSTRLELVSRPRLQASMMDGLRGPLTLITAPAGFGKTTLAASCLADCGLPVAWLSLDQDDNQVERFLSYLIAAFQDADHSIGSEAERLLAQAQHVPPNAVLTSLINDLDAANREIVLVLDDYQFIRSRDVHAAVAFIFEYCPQTLHIVVATRSDPPWALARLRARAQTVELRAVDLAFTVDEAGQFLNDVMGLGLDAGSVAALERRTEGWIAGLQMAALSMRDREDIAGFIESFSGTNRYILDYLLEEVLASQPPEIQRFLLQTSILERLTAPLCDAVLGDAKGLRVESADRPTQAGPLHPGQSASILEHLEQANLFLIPLDDERKWYRYHHLFAELLRSQLRRYLDGQEIARLHLQAAAWYEHEGPILDAIQHASLASDDAMVERLIGGHYLEMVNHGEMSSIRFWLGTLSEEVIFRRPWLCLYEALSRSWFGQLEEATLLLNAAEKHFQAGVGTPDHQTMLGYHAFVKSRVAAMQGDTQRAIEFCLTAWESISADNLALQNEFSTTLGYEYFLLGDFHNAAQALQETIRSGETVKAINNPVAAYALLARAQAYQGRLYEAYDLLQKAERLIQEAGSPYLGALGLIEVEAAALLCEWNDLEVALVRVKRGLDCLPWWGKADDLCLAYITLSRIHFALGNRAEGADALEKAAQFVQAGGIFSEAHHAVEAARVNFWLAEGDLRAASRWAESQEQRKRPKDRFGFENELAQITQARVLIAQDRAAKAAGLLSHLEGTARSSGRMGRTLQIIILKALALQDLGDEIRADIALEESLALAGPEGYTRIYLDEGRRMEGLLQAYSRRAEGAQHGYASKLLRAFNAAASREGGTSAAPGQPAQLVESLTGREVEVLGLLASGLSNREIAERLVLSEGTVKTHTHNLYGKLGVKSRTQAIVRGKELNLI